LSFPYILAIALALAMDAFAVSLGIGISRSEIKPAQILRLALAFGPFQSGMTLIGAFAGANLIKHIRSFDHWLAAGLLFFVAAKMAYESFKEPHLREGDPTRGLALLVLAVATSIDALAVGLSLAALHTSLFYPAAVIGLVAFVLTIAGVKIGPLFGRLVGRWAEILGAAVLLLIGVRILVTHLRG
jgi:putative Mn2+ efflux pump MntP